jgi:hypothetical protein
VGHHDRDVRRFECAPSVGRDEGAADQCLRTVGDGGEHAGVVRVAGGRYLQGFDLSVTQQADGGWGVPGTFRRTRVAWPRMMLC